MEFISYLCVSVPLWLILQDNFPLIDTLETLATQIRA
jgi:hypothetical protein